MGRLRGLGAASGLALAAALVATPVAADERTEARRHFQDGMRLLEEGDVDGGVAELQLAYEILPHRNVLYNIARAYLDGGRRQEAVPYLERYLATDPPDRSEVEGLLEALRAEAEAERRPAPVDAPPEAVAEDEATLVTDEEIQALEEAADQIGALARTAESETLARRADRLRELAAALRRRRANVDGASAPAAVAAVAPGGPGPTLVDPEASAASASAGAALGFAGEDTGEAYEEQIVSASRTAQRPLDAPNSTGVVTNQDIRLSGLIQPGETLRRVAGVEVMTQSPGDVQVSIRGLNQRLSNRAVVLVDGRSIYLDFLGATLWSFLPVPNEQIERIEVIRGPASALYGADAFTGIINILTRPIGEGGSWISGTVGNGETYRVSAGSSARVDRVRFRLSGGFERTDQFARIVGPDRVDIFPFANSPDKAYDRLFFGGDAQIRLDGGYTLTGGVGINRGDRTIQGVSRLREIFLEDATFAQTYLAFQTPVGLSSRVFWNRFETDYGNSDQIPGGIEIAQRSRVSRSDVFDAELVYGNSFAIGTVENAVIGGFSYRFKEVDWNWIADPVTGDPVRTQHHFGGFLQDTLRIDEVVQVVASVRLDVHPLLSSPQVSPRGSILVHPTQRQTIRLTGGTAFRGPTFTESYASVPNTTPLRGVTAYGVGDQTLDPERIVSVELGYMLQESDRFSLEVNGYYNLVFDQILLSENQVFRLADQQTNPRAGYQPELGAVPLGQLVFANESQTFRQLGGELVLRVYPVDGVDLYANYAIHETTPQTDQPFGGRELDQRTSTHKVNVGAQYRSTFGLDLSADFSWVSSQRWVEQVLDTESGGTAFVPFDLPAYAVLNARVGYRLLDDNLELAVVGTNLVDDGHREHPFGQPTELRVMGWVTARIR